MRKSFKFNNIRKPWLYLEKGRSKPPFAAVSREILKVPGMPGGYLEGTEIEPLVIRQPVGFKVKDDEHALQLKEELADWLFTEKSAPLELDDEPGRTYYAIVQNTLDDFDRIVSLRRGTIQFLCLDPYGFGDEENATFSNDGVTIMNNGTVETKPRFEIDVLKDTLFMDLVSAVGPYMRVGEPGELDTPPYERRSLVMDDLCTSTEGWNVADAVDNGYIRGNILATPDGFVPETFGAAVEPYAWQGPSLKKQIVDVNGNPMSVDNFQLDIPLELLNVGNGTGMIEAYCKDIDNHIVTKIGIEDVWRGMERIQAKMQLGDIGNREQYYTQADYGYGWNDFKGIMRLYRDDYSGEKRIRPYFAIRKPDGTHDWVRSQYYYEDVEENYQNPITQIQLAFRKWPSRTEAKMKVNRVTLWEYHTEPEKIPYLLRAGDKVIIDMKDRLILINGEDRTEELGEFGVSFFSLYPGGNTLFQFPENTFQTKIYWSPKYR
ncbi:putative phage tail component, N-terminal domain-containing protein [Halobacillus karajensis]|uniref:distal tail protein Dit n=1 Tax=Halobacillus karajensis TaxID=195088 RepID=UPI0008A7A5D0|nr:distal tail protein Dit [Halobacillus karajensis]SEH78525.1 putative phage tail component, N-terminal domain-containing protein [Halobacillus karajensis]